MSAMQAPVSWKKNRLKMSQMKPDEPGRADRQLENTTDKKTARANANALITDLTLWINPKCSKKKPPKDEAEW